MSVLAIVVDLHEAEYRTLRVSATNQSELGLAKAFRVSNVSQDDSVCVYLHFQVSTASQVHSPSLKLRNSDGKTTLIAPLHVYEEPVVTFWLDRRFWANALLEVHLPGDLVAHPDTRDLCLVIDIPSYNPVSPEEYERRNPPQQEAQKNSDRSAVIVLVPVALAVAILGALLYSVRRKGHNRAAGSD